MPSVWQSKFYLIMHVFLQVIVEVEEKFGALRIYFREKGLPTEVLD